MDGLSSGRLLWRSCCVLNDRGVDESKECTIISIDSAFQITNNRFDPTTATKDMEVNVELGRFGESFDEVRWRRVKMGGGDYPKGVQSSPLNELSDELSGGLIGRVVAELSG